MEARGFHLVAANYRSRFGEIDLIMLQEDLLAFVEVRLRNSLHFGGAAASITVGKQQKIIASAQAFLQHRPEFCRCNCRFDVIAIQTAANGWRIEWLPAAFVT